MKVLSAASPFVMCHVRCVMSQDSCAMHHAPHIAINVATVCCTELHSETRLSATQICSPCKTQETITSVTCIAQHHRACVHSCSRGLRTVQACCRSAWLTCVRPSSPLLTDTLCWLLSLLHCMQGVCLPVGARLVPFLPFSTWAWLVTT